MTQSLYEAAITISKLQKHYANAIKIRILTRDSSLFETLSTAKMIKFQSEHDRSTNETIKYGKLKIGDLPPKAIETTLTQTAVIDLVNASREHLTIFGIILPNMHKDKVDLTYSTDFDDIRIILDEPAINAPLFQPFLDEIQSEINRSTTPVTQTDDTFSLLNFVDQSQIQSNTPQTHELLLASTKDNFISRYASNSELEKELSLLIADPDLSPSSRTTISRPLAERWFILLSKLALPIMDNWFTPVDQNFVSILITHLLSNQSSSELTIKEMILLVTNFSNKDKSYELLKICLGLHTRAETTLIRNNRLHTCSFLVSCPFNYINDFHSRENLHYDSFYRFYLKLVAIQIYSSYNSEILDELDIKSIQLNQISHTSST